MVSPVSVGRGGVWFLCVWCGVWSVGVGGVGSEGGEFFVYLIEVLVFLLV